MSSLLLDWSLFEYFRSAANETLGILNVKLKKNNKQCKRSLENNNNDTNGSPRSAGSLPIN